MSDFFGRLGNLVKGAAENFMKGLENDNPEAVIQAALETQAERVSELSGHVATMTRRVENRRREIPELEQELVQLTSRAATLASTDEAQALQVLELKERTREKLETAQASLLEDQKRLDDTTEALARSKAELEKLKREKDQMLVDFHTLTQKNEQSALDQGVATSAAYQAVQNVRDSLGKADELLKKSRDDKEIRRQKALAELEALKQRKQPEGEATSSPEGAVRTRSLDAPSPAEPSANPGASTTPAPSSSDPASSPIPRRSL